MATRKIGPRKRAAAKGDQTLASALGTAVEVEHKVAYNVGLAGQEVWHDATEAKHALDRMSFWGGMSLLLLAVVLFAHGVGAITYMGAGLAGTLALMIE